MFDVGSKLKMTDMDSKRATTKCIATGLVCQLYSVFFLLILFIRFYAVTECFAVNKVSATQLEKFVRIFASCNLK